LTEWDQVVNNVLNILGLICCWIKKRLNYLEFEQMIRKYDIICLVETKTDDIDIVKLEGYEIHMKNRKIVAKNINICTINIFIINTNVIIRNITSVTICVVQTSSINTNRYK
jgi:uncharacterized protein YqgQ